MVKTKFYFIFFMLYAIPFCIRAQDVDTDVKQLQSEIATLTEEVSKLKDSQKDIQVSSNELRAIQKNHLTRISSLEKENNSIQKTIDSVKTNSLILSKTQREDKEQLTTQIGYTKKEIKINQDLLSNRTNIGSILFVFILITIIAIAITFLRKFKKGVNSIDEVRKAQNSLEQAQKSLQEESIKLDNKLLEIVERQLNTTSQTIACRQKPDHSLVIKLANEIARIETNLAKMDKSVRGYKQLVQAKDRMINNVRANGYEIISLLGQEYDDGMQFEARFVPDYSLPEGKRIITGMIKMLVNYNGEMIQPAEIVVSQNI